MLADLAILCVIVIGLLLLLPRKSQLTPAQRDFQMEQTMQRMGRVPVPDDVGPPSVSAIFIQAPQGGWHLFLTTPNFAFAGDPEYSSFAARGHAHLFIDGRSWGSIYTRLYHIGGLDPGEHTLHIFLMSSSSQVFTDDGKPIGTSLTVDIRREETDPKPFIMTK